MCKELSKLLKRFLKEYKENELLKNEIENDISSINHIKDYKKQIKSNKYFYIGFSNENERFYSTNLSTSIKVESVCTYYKDFQKMILNIFNEIIKEKEDNLLKKLKKLYNI